MFEGAAIRDIELEVGQRDELTLFLERLRDFSWTIALKGKDQLEILSISQAIPSFFIEHLQSVMKSEFLEKTVKFMNQYSSHKKISLRVNSLTSPISLESLINIIRRDFNQKGIALQKDQDIPFLLHVPIANKKEIVTSKWYENNTLIFQDKASAAIAKLLKPVKGDFICDLCAAPGIKSSLIMQLSNNQSRLLCNDFSNPRLQFTKSFFLNMKVMNTFLLNSDGINLAVKFGIKFDKILIDAPCTGSGTFLSNPELKWRQNHAFLNQNIVIQKKLIKSALNLLKPGGILVYSTCSLYPEEGEYQINEIYDQMIPLDIPDYFSPSYKINKKILKGTGRLFPSIHSTQGFFVSKLKKK